MNDQRYAWRNLDYFERIGYYDLADAVLAVIGDRLLPELPEDIDRVYVELDTVGGDGPNPVAAIRDALGNRELYSRLHPNRGK